MDNKIEIVNTKQKVYIMSSLPPKFTTQDKRTLTLFVKTLEDIQKRLEITDTYETLRVSGLLRQLLFDSQPLVNQVNRYFRQSIRFEVMDAPPYPANLPAPMIHWKSVYISDLPTVKTKRISLQDFLKVECLIYQGINYNVQDIIKACAHQRGGVHHENPQTDEGKLLLELDDLAQFGGWEPTLLSLRGIAKVVLNALEPLRIATIKHLEAVS